MGRASWVAFMPTGFMSGGSLAPMENSPPGIQTMPGGGEPGAGVLFALVGPKPLDAAALSGASDGEAIEGAAAETATVRERCPYATQHATRSANATPAITNVRRDVSRCRLAAEGHTGAGFSRLVTEVAAILPRPGPTH